ncbi:hypothetical protein [Ligilactobacillus equi]|uniref:hypothetical protein n=1 Tax=Ligilactobacillus equi TaxID=137357 RepID=UPI00046A4881|nr:hypothetical protein [Ligilactobacillus equi]
MEIKKEYTLEEISKWLSEINYPKKVRTLREWFKDIQPSNGISRPSKYDYDTVISIIKEKINNNKSKKETLKEMIKKDEDEIFNSLKRQEEEGYIYPGEAIDLFYQNDISNWEEDAYKKAEEYAEKKTTEYKSIH